MNYKKKYRSESLRLQNWDYSWNAIYFVTINAKNRNCYFGNIENHKIYLTLTGEIANECWLEIPQHFSFVKLGNYIIMPDHMHGLLIFNNIIDENNINTCNDNDYRNGNGFGMDKACLVHTGITDITGDTVESVGWKRFQNQGENTLSSVIGSFKSSVSRIVHRNNIEFEWQPDFYEHIVRNAKSYKNISNYISNNPHNIR